MLLSVPALNKYHSTTCGASCQLSVFPHVECSRDDIIPSDVNVTGGAMSVEDRMTTDKRRKYRRKMQWDLRTQDDWQHPGSPVAESDITTTDVRLSAGVGRLP